MLQGAATETLLDEDPDAFDAEISCLRLVTNEDGLELIFAGFDDGSLRIWEASNLRLRASCSVFADQIQQILVIRDPKAIRLVNKVLLTGQDGSIALFDMQELRV